MQRINNHKQKGAVAIFVVIFAALFITIITVSFVGIMLKNQTQSINADLADSAYDSALAGVEDAKRLFQKYKQCEVEGGFNSGNTVCDAVKSAIEDECFGVKKFITQSPTASGETLIQRSANTTGDVSLDQAYTCVKLNLDLTYRDGSIEAGKYDVIPLVLKGSGGATFNKIKIGWYTTGSDSDHGTGPVSYYGSPLRFPADSVWPANAPPVLRVQLANLSGSFNLSDFDFDTAGTRRTGTTFLYPRGTGTSQYAILPNPSPISPINCIPTTIGYKTYHCNAELTLPAQSINPPSYLILSSIYGATHYSIQVLDGADPFIFTNVASVDSTGRANDIFRRVSAQIELDTTGGGTAPDYPAAALEVSKLCKNFSVTDRGADFSSSGCAP